MSATLYFKLIAYSVKMCAKISNQMFLHNFIINKIINVGVWLTKLINYKKKRNTNITVTFINVTYVLNIDIAQSMFVSTSLHGVTVAYF